MNQLFQEYGWVLALLCVVNGLKGFLAYYFGVRLRRNMRIREVAWASGLVVTLCVLGPLSLLYAFVVTGYPSWSFIVLVPWGIGMSLAWWTARYRDNLRKDKENRA